MGFLYHQESAYPNEHAAYQRLYRKLFVKKNKSENQSEDNAQLIDWNNLAEQNNVQSIAFCCISTGVFHFPADRAAQIAVQTVENWKREHDSGIKVVFNVFSEKDEAIYREILF